MSAKMIHSIVLILTAHRKLVDVKLYENVLDIQSTMFHI